MRRVHTGLIFFAAAAVLAAPAAAHLSAEPSFLAVGARQRIVLSVHNDRDETMTGFRLTAPEGLRIVRAGGGGGWNEIVDDGGESAEWSGAALAPDTPVAFEVELEATTTRPGTLELAGDQLYADEEAVRWDVALTIVPPGASPATSDEAAGGATIAILVAGAALALGAVAVLLVRRRRAAHGGA